MVLAVFFFILFFINLKSQSTLYYGWLVAAFHKTHFYIYSKYVFSCSWPAVFIAVMVCFQGKVAEINIALAGSLYPYMGKESRY